MKNIITIFLLLLSLCSFGQTIVSWNIKDLGKAKFERDTICPDIAHVLKQTDADIIAIQEVVLSSWGDSAVAQIAGILDMDYIISGRTEGKGAERFAYLWNKEVELEWASLDHSVEEEFQREPYFASFCYHDSIQVELTQVHLVPKSKNPQAEIAQLKRYKHGIICGDFNLTSKHLVYIPLWRNFRSGIEKGALTSLKKDGSLNESYDHFLVGKEYEIEKGYVFMYPYKWDRGKLSDHLPIVLILEATNQDNIR